MFTVEGNKIINFVYYFISYKAELAQSVERAPFKRVAVGSSPTFGNVKIFFKDQKDQFVKLIN